MSSDRDVETQDLAFERLLLEAARADAPPSASVDRAWHQFAARVSATAVVAGVAPDPSAVANAARRAILKWVGLGLVGGSALTALWMRSGGTPHIHDPAAGRAAPISQSRAEGSSPGVQSISPAPAVTQRASADAPAAREAVPQRPASAVRKGQQRARLASSAESSQLAREIAALDSIRTTLGANDWSSAVRLTDEYHREFPNGQLAADAHVLLIGALHARGNRDEARRRAASFLARYPNDPHAARLERLVER